MLPDAGGLFVRPLNCARGELNQLPQDLELLPARYSPARMDKVDPEPLASQAAPAHAGAVDGGDLLRVSCIVKDLPSHGKDYVLPATNDDLWID